MLISEAGFEKGRIDKTFVIRAVSHTYRLNAKKVSLQEMALQGMGTEGNEQE